MRVLRVVLVLFSLVLAGAVAVVTPAQASTGRTVSLTASVSTVTSGQKVTFSGTVSRSGRGATVYVERAAGKGWTRVASTRTTSAGGRYSLVVKLTGSGRQVFRARAPKTGVFGQAVSRSRAVAVNRAATVGLAVSNSAPRLGSTITFTGRAKPFAAGATVTLQRANAGVFKTVPGASAKLSTKGTFTIKHTPLAGAWTYRVAVAGSKTKFIAAATSPSRQVDAEGPASLQVQVLDVPSGKTADVTVTAPGGTATVIHATTTFADAAVGTWKVSGASIAATGGTVYPVVNNLAPVVKRGASAVAIIDYTVTVPDTTTVVNPAKVDAVTSSGSTTVLDLPAAAKVPSTGDVVAVGVGPKTPQGLLGKVTSVSGDAVTLDTDNVTLMDAVQVGSFDVSQPLDADAVVAADTPARAIRTTAARGMVSGPVRTTTSKSVTEKVKKNLKCTKSSEATLETSVEVAPTVNFSANWGGLSVKDAKITAGITQTASITATVHGENSCTLDRTALLGKPITFASITFSVGPVPVVLVPQLQFYLDGTERAEATLTTGVTQKFSATAGVAYTRGSGFSPVYNASNTVTRTGPSFTGQADAEAGVTPDLAILLYGAGGPHVSVRAALAADAKASTTTAATTLDWNLDLKLKVSATLAVDVLNLSSGELTLVDNTFDVASGHLAYSFSAPTISTTSLPGGTTGTHYSQQLKTTDNRNGTWSRTAGTLPPGLTLSGDTITGTPTTAGTYSFTIGFTDIWGHQAGGGFSIAVASGGGGGGGGGGGEAGIRTTALAGSWLAVTAGDYHTCAVRVDHTLWCWGSNDYGQLGLGDNQSRMSPQQVGSDRDWSQVSAGGSHTCGIRADGSLWCWGRNSSGDLGLGDTTDRVAPVRVGAVNDWSTIHAGRWHTCGTQVDGTLWCWGNNGSVQLGVDDINDRHVPTQVGSGTDWSSIAAGWDHTCGIRVDGSLWCWGFDELKNGSGYPTRVGSDADWATISVGQDKFCATKSAGDLWCWRSWDTAPTRVGTDTAWATMTSDPYNPCLISKNGALWCFIENAVSPTPVGATTGWAEATTGLLHTCAILTSGDLWCWGYNGYGELGLGDTTDRIAPA